jgi:hypothetical protein
MTALYVLAGVVSVVLALAAVAAMVGLVLPRDHLAARRATFAAPPTAVWQGLVELSAASDVPFAVEVDDSPRLRITRISDDTLPYGGRWIYQLEPVGEGTRLTITEDGWVSNPIFRLVTAIAPNATKTKFLRALGDKLGVAVDVEPAEPASRSLLVGDLGGAGELDVERPAAGAAGPGHR